MDLFNLTDSERIMLLLYSGPLSQEEERLLDAYRAMPSAEKEKFMENLRKLIEEKK